MKDETRIARAGLAPQANHGIINPPVYHASTVIFPTLEALERYDSPVVYGRTGTPTTHALEEAITELEGADGVRIAPSGLAAISVSLLSSLKSGDHLLMTDGCYAPTRRFCDTVLHSLGIATSYYDPLVTPELLTQLIRPNTRAVFLEAPSSLTFEMQDIPRLAQVSRQAGLRVIMDNTWATPLFFKPLAHGVDLSIQAGTKYISGHSDVMIGTVAANNGAFKDLSRVFAALGLCAGPDDIYLALRGLRTLSIRLARHQETARHLIAWLREQQQIANIFYPALPGDPGHKLWTRDFSGASGLFGLELKPCSKAGLAAMLDHLKLFKMGYSWGGFESLIVPFSPVGQRSVTRQRFTDRGPFLRLHAGLEAAEDLLDDLSAGLDRLSAHESGRGKVEG
jgi:cystathionine beta-lyase